MIETKPVSVLSTPAPAVFAPERPAAAVDFGFFTSDSGAKSTLQELASTLSAKIGEAMNAVATVQVKTYSTASLTDKPGVDPFTGANLRAISEIRLDGNARICVPEKDGQVDTAFWKLHADMVDKALANRIEMFKLAASAASSLLSALKQL
jgi:hypothetical protein